MEPESTPVEDTSAEGQQPAVSMADANFPNTTNTYMIHNTKIQWTNIALIVAAIILALSGVLTNAWNVQDTTAYVIGNEATVTTEAGLHEVTVTACSGGLCETIEDDLSTIAACPPSGETADGFSPTIFEGSNSELSGCDIALELKNTGMITMYIIIPGILVLLVPLGLLIPVTRAGRTPAAWKTFTSFLGATLILAGVLYWYFTQPSGTALGETNLGLSAWLAIFSVGIVTYVGFSPLLFPPKYRPSGIGARVLSDDDEGREFVVRESCTGNQTLSILEDGHLFRISRANRNLRENQCEDLFTTRMEALLGFSHARFDWLDKTRYLWNFLAFMGLILTISAYGDTLIVYSNWFILLFSTGIVLSLFQFADPELLTFETNTGKYRLLIYRAGSNRPLTNASMDCIDSAMRSALSGNEIDPSSLNQRAEQIESEKEEIHEAIAAEAAANQQAQAQMQAQMQAQAQAQMQAQAQAQMQAQAQAQQAVATPPTAAPTMPPVTNPTPIPAPTEPPLSASMPPPADVATPLPPLPPNLDPNLVAGMVMPTETIADAPEVPMQAAPRDESLSEGEKEDILSDLGDD